VSLSRDFDMVSLPLECCLGGSLRHIVQDTKPRVGNAILVFPNGPCERASRRGGSPLARFALGSRFEASRTLAG